MFKTFFSQISIERLFVAAVGAILSVLIIWLAISSTNILLNLIWAIVVLGLFLIAATLLARLIMLGIFKSETDHGIPLEADGDKSYIKGKGISFPKIIQSIWDNRQLLLTFLALLFLLFILKIFISLADLMIGYLEIDNLRSQNEIMDAQNDAVFIDSVGTIDTRLAILRAQSDDLERVKQSWGSLAMPYYVGDSTISSLDQYLCDDASELFICEPYAGAMLKNVETDVQLVANSVARGIIWYHLERDSRQSESNWGTADPGQDGGRAWVLGPLQTPDSTVFTSGISGSCGSTQSNSVISVDLLNRLLTFENAFVSASSAPSHQPGFTTGMRNHLDDLTINLEMLDSQLKNAFDKGHIRFTFQFQEAYDFTQLIDEFVSAEQQLQSFWELCHTRTSEVNVSLERLKQQRSELVKRVKDEKLQRALNFNASLDSDLIIAPESR